MLAEEIPFSGPNCFNTSLHFIGLQKGPRHVSEKEMKFLVENYCQELNPEEDSFSKVGVLALLVDEKSQNPVHSYVHSSHSTVHTKNGMSKRAKIEEQDFNQMYQIHKTAYLMDCQRKEKRDCNLQIKYFNCSKSIEKNLLMESIRFLESMYEARELFFKQESIDEFKDLIEEESSNQILSKSANDCTAFDVLFDSIFKSVQYISWNPDGPIELARMNSLFDWLRIQKTKRPEHCPGL